MSRVGKVILVLIIVAMAVTMSFSVIAFGKTQDGIDAVDAVPTTPVKSDGATQARVNEAYGKLPLSFEANQGQSDARVKFLSRGRGYTLFLTPSEAVLSLSKPAAPTTANAEDTHATVPTVLHMQLVGANPEPEVTGLEELPGKSNYFVGNDSDKWHTDVPHYAKVEYQDVYPGIDLVYYGNQRQLEYDFVVAPSADPTAIQLSFEGADKFSLDAQGNLILNTAGGEVIQHAPLIYQEVNGVKQPIPGGYVLHGKHQVGFQLGAYDASKPLVIDPVLSYSTYLGGGHYDYGEGITIDSSGNTYVSGYTYSTNFPTQNAYQETNAGYGDAFVTKLSASGSSLIFSTYLGGGDNDFGEGIAIDATGNAYVTGYTVSTNFPTQNAYQETFAGGIDAFVTKLDTRPPVGGTIVQVNKLGLVTPWIIVATMMVVAGVWLGIWNRRRATGSP